MNGTLRSREPGASAPTSVQVLGRFAVRTPAGEVDPRAFGGRLSRRLVRLLAIRQGTVVTRDALISALWPERAPSNPDANLNVLVSRARRAVGEPGLIVTSAVGYALAGSDRCLVDAAQLMERAATGHTHLEARRADAALHHLLEALELWGEPLAEDASEEWAQPHRRQLSMLHQQVLEHAAAAALALRDPVQAVEYAQAALRHEPLRENAADLLLRALIGSGDRAAALTEYDQFRRRLAQELGVDPSAGLQDLHGQILRDELPAAMVTASPGTTASAPPRLPFVGRDPQVSAILAAIQPPRRPVIVAGTSGAGKSRLLTEVERLCPIPAVYVAAFVAESDRSWSVVRTLLREALALDVEVARCLTAPARTALSDILPELAGAGDPRRFDAETLRSLRTEGAVRLLEEVSSGGLVVLLDDLQWADASSLELLDVAISRIGDLRPVLAFRPEEIEPDHPMTALREHLRRFSDVLDLELGALPESALARLITDDTLLASLVRGTDGTPLAVSEALAALGAAELVRPDGDRWRLSEDAPRASVDAIVAAGQRRAIDLRIGRQPMQRRRLLSALALLGREVSANLLAAALERRENDLLRDLDRLHAAHLAHPGEGGWRTSHDLVAETAARRLESGARAELHHQLALALAAEPADSAEVARHLAGAGDRRQAAEAFGRAAQARLDEHANREAHDLANQALTLAPEHTDRAWLVELRAETRSRTDDLSGARLDLREAIAQRPAGPPRARSLARLAMLESGADDLQHAEQLITLALTESRSDDRVHAHALSVAAIVDMNLGREERALARSDEALRLFSDLGDARGVADILDGRAMATFLDGRIRDAVGVFEDVANDFEDQGELLRVITPRSTRGHGLLFMDRPADGLVETEAALALARTLGHAEGVSYTQWHRSEVLAALGRTTEARAAAGEALGIARELGHRGWTATGLLALGTAEAASGRFEQAAAAYQEARRTAHGLPLFAAWAAARLGLTIVREGRIDEATTLADQAAVDAPGLARYEILVLRATLAVQGGHPGAAQVCQRAMATCRHGGHERARRTIANLNSA